MYRPDDYGLRLSASDLSPVGPVHPSGWESEVPEAELGSKAPKRRGPLLHEGESTSGNPNEPTAGHGCF